MQTSTTPKPQVGDGLATTTQHARHFRALVGLSAACRDQDTNLWFPEPWEDPTPALTVCARCVVRAQCLQLALGAGERFGVWGGTTEQERRRLRRRQAGSADTEVA